MKHIAAISSLLLITTAASFAQDSPRWIRKSCISPDGKSIVFSYQGDLFTVPSKGGEAKQITSNSAYETDPLWTADGKSIVFSSTREGSKDIFITAADGGSPARVTSFNGSETPLAVLPSGRILFSADIQADALYSGFPGSEQLYSIAADGQSLRQETSLTFNNIAINQEGKVLYEDDKGYEDPFRKHHTSSVTRDIWLCTPSGASDGSLGINGNASFSKLSQFKGENRNPVFAGDGSTYYFLSEQSGSFNVWESSIGGNQKAVQVTSFTTHPVRYLSISNDGTLAFSFNGDLYTLRDGANAEKVEIVLKKDKLEKDLIYRTIASGAGDIAISPNGKEIALVAHGDVFVTSIEQKTTKRITNTPERERGVTFSEDGRTLYYAADRNGRWGIWKTSLSDKNEKYFSVSYKMTEERVTSENQTCFQPEVSPDGKWLAYLRDRQDIIIKNLKTGKEKDLLVGANYSYSDGDQQFCWSPDSRYILCNYGANGGWNNQDIALLDIEKGGVTDLTQSGYSDGGFRWVLGGKAMLWSSDKMGYRSHGSWGAEDDIYVMFFDGKAYYDFTKDKESEGIDKLLEPEGKKADKADSTKTEKKVKPLKLDLDNRFDRIVRLTPSSGTLGDYILNQDGTKLYYSIRLEKGFDLCEMDIRDRSIKIIQKGVSGRITASPDGKTAFIRTGSGISKFDLGSGKLTAVNFESEYDYNPSAERTYIFNHAWQQVLEKFYDPEIHGIDWVGYRDNYAQFLPYITNNYDFKELLSEMLGELNGSHTGARYRPGSSLNTGWLGVIYDNDYKGPGLKIKEILPGSPLVTAYPDIKAGYIVEEIDGRAVNSGTEWYNAFSMKASKKVLVRVRGGNKTKEFFCVPASSESNMLYTRWVRRNEQLVEKLSGGKIGYVHVEGMDSESFREVYSKALGKYRGCDALIVDTRHNGGGWLHEDLEAFLSGKAYMHFEPRGNYIGTEPYNRWTKPSCVLIGEDNYSDACGFPYAYKAMGIGKLIGAPVPGTMTAVWWETQLDQTLVFGIPQVGVKSLKDKRYIENLQLEPDILVYNDPASELRGEDIQLATAVKEMLKATGNE